MSQKQMLTSLGPLGTLQTHAVRFGLYPKQYLERITQQQRLASLRLFGILQTCDVDVNGMFNFSEIQTNQSLCTTMSSL